VVLRSVHVGIGRGHTATAHSIRYPPEESLHKEGARWVGLRGSGEVVEEGDDL
jgi:hypothetical protein